MKNSPRYERWNNKKIKEFHKILKEQFGFQGKLDYVFLFKKDKIYIISKDLDKLSIDKLNINTSGLYIAKQEAAGIRLSIEGSQLIGPNCSKNILKLEDPTDWMQGNNASVNEKLKSNVLISYKKDFLGSGIYKKNKILNFIPKSRRIKSANFS